MVSVNDSIDTELIQQLESEGVYRPEDCIKVCGLMMTGKSVAQSCREVNLADSTFHTQIFRSQTLGERYARAREIQIDVLMDDLLTPVDYDDFRDDDGRIDNGAVQLFKAQRDDKKWYASKVRGKVYGDRVDHTVSSNQRKIMRIEHVIVPAPNEKPALPADEPALLSETSEQTTEQNGA